MVVAALLIVVIAALVALYLIRPHYQRVSLSAARFFEDSPESKESKTKLHFRNLLLSRAFWSQLATLLALLAAVFLANFVYLKGTDESMGLWNVLANFANLKETEESIGLWLVLDTSASMSTRSKDTVCPTSPAIFSTLRISPSRTLYCFPPEAITAYMV